MGFLLVFFDKTQKPNPAPKKIGFFPSLIFMYSLVFRTSYQNLNPTHRTDLQTRNFPYLRGISLKSFVH